MVRHNFLLDNSRRGGYVRNNLEVAPGTVRLIYVNAGSRLAHHDVATD